MTAVHVQHFSLPGPGERILELDHAASDILVVAWAGLIQPESEFTHSASSTLQLRDARLVVRSGDTVVVAFVIAEDAQTVFRGSTAVSMELTNSVGPAVVSAGRTRMLVADPMQMLPVGKTQVAAKLTGLKRAAASAAGHGDMSASLLTHGVVQLSMSATSQATASAHLNLGETIRMVMAPAGKAVVTARVRHLSMLRMAPSGAATAEFSARTIGTIHASMTSAGATVAAVVPHRSRPISMKPAGKGSGVASASVRPVIQIAMTPGGVGGGEARAHHVRHLRTRPEGVGSAWMDASGGASTRLFMRTEGRSSALFDIYVRPAVQLAISAPGATAFDDPDLSHHRLHRLAIAPAGQSAAACDLSTRAGVRMAAEVVGTSAVQMAAEVARLITHELSFTAAGSAHGASYLALHYGTPPVVESEPPSPGARFW